MRHRARGPAASLNCERDSAPDSGAMREVLPVGLVNSWPLP